MLAKSAYEHLPTVLPYACICISHGAGAVTISRLLPHVVKLLGDPGAPVRDTAFNTLVEAYRHYGDRLRTDLANKYPVPPAKNF
ncbi:hypothetical protein HAZT_HAZT004749 [Hyalella azteca]|uniref:CLASP N-terminal domain-containing protein n=1 Tax=Hyalella azteca TaxID=294128 RepID=A0A6A0GSC3_HYAAZ|nr:hypothetical protein HAZT_HAZT004749 [Hyalella azteca]